MQSDNFKNFYVCSNCGKAICGERETYFICPSCGKALCKKSDIENFDNNYCGNCGTYIASTLKQVLAMIDEEQLK